MNLSNQRSTQPDLRYTGITIPYVGICDRRGDSNLLANAIAIKARADREEKQADTPTWFYLSAALVALGAILSGKSKGGRR